MENIAFFADLAAILETETEELHQDFPFNRENWNSLSIVSAIVIIDEHFGVAIEGEKLRECKSVGELWQLIQAAIDASK